jgi:hypothetical protein
LFVQAQLKAAIKLNDPFRSIRVTIQIKDLVFQRSASMFDFVNYPKLRSNHGWQALKLISFKREELAAGNIINYIEQVLFIFFF